MEADSDKLAESENELSESQDEKGTSVPMEMDQPSVDTAVSVTTDSQADDKTSASEDELSEVQVKDRGPCYCGKDRSVGSVELRCANCLKWFHLECISCYIGNFVPFVTNYHFCCKRCNPSGVESFCKKTATFNQMCLTAVANLTYQQSNQPEPKTLFSKDKEIIPFLDKHWENLTSMPRRVKLNWHNTMNKKLNKDTESLICNEDIPGDPHFGLLDPDLSKISPQYELKPSVSGKPGDTKPGIGTAELRTRGTKRRFPQENSQLAGIKQKRSDVSAIPKMALHGYPPEHPYNKDGYRYILAESDPHAPGRQAFDESQEWAGKPIPGYLYRKFLSSEVLLALHDRATQLRVSEDRMTVTGDKGYCLIRATHGVNYGSWYFETTIDEMPPETASRIGWCQKLGNLQAPVGYDKFSYSWRSRKGTVFHQSRGKHYSNDGFSVGDVLGFHLYSPTPTNPSMLLPAEYKDKPLVKFKSHLYYEEKDYVTETEKMLTPVKGSKIVMYKNGQSCGVAFTNIFDGTYYPAISLYKNAVVSINFGPTFKYPPKDIKNYLPMSASAEDAMIKHALADLLYHVENEGKHPDFSV